MKDIVELINLLNSGDYTTLTAIVIIFIYIWLFKDIKNSLLDTKKSNLKFIDKSIEAHAQSIKSIYLFTNNSINECDLLDTLYSSHIYFDNHVLDLIEKLISTNNVITLKENSNLLISLAEELKRKLHILKNKQYYDAINKNHKLSIFDFGDKTIQNNFDIYLNALFYSSITMAISLMFLYLFLQFSILGLNYLLPTVILLIFYIFWLLLTQISLDLFLQKYYKKKYLFVIFFLSPFVLTYLIKSCENYIIKIVFLLMFIISVISQFYVNIQYSKLIPKNKVL